MEDEEGHEEEEQEAVGEMGGAVPGETNKEESKLL